MDSSREERINIFGQAALEFLLHSLFRRGTMNAISLQRKVVVEAGEELATVEIPLLQPFKKIKMKNQCPWSEFSAYSKHPSVEQLRP